MNYSKIGKTARVGSDTRADSGLGEGSELIESPSTDGQVRSFLEQTREIVAEIKMKWRVKLEQEDLFCLPNKLAKLL